MREILFHGKRVDNGEWVEGYFGVFNGKPQIFVPFTEEEERQNEGHIFSAVGGLWHQVILETVGQFTGKHDVTGRKIFEGNIVTATVIENTFGSSVTKYTRSYIVAYHPEYCYFYLKRNKNNLLFDGNWNYGVFISEVIGNIHDNPEFLSDIDSI